MTNYPHHAKDSLIGILGLGLLSRNLILAIARQGFPVVAYDVDPGRISELRGRTQGLPVEVFSTIEEFAGQLRPPRAILMLMPGGPHLETTFRNLSSHLNAGDLIIDGASYHHLFTPRRRKFFAGHGIHFLATGIAAAGHGYDYGCRDLFPELAGICRRIRPLFEAVAATSTGEPCVTFVVQQVEHHLRHLETVNHVLVSHESPLEHPSRGSRSLLPVREGAP